MPMTINPNLTIISDQGAAVALIEAHWKRRYTAPIAVSHCALPDDKYWRVFTVIADHDEGDFRPVEAYEYLTELTIGVVYGPISFGEYAIPEGKCVCLSECWHVHLITPVCDVGFM